MAKSRFTFDPQSARELIAVTWGHELSNALTQCNTVLKRMDEEGESPDHQPFRKLSERVKAALRNVWKDSPQDVFDIGYVSQSGVLRIEVKNGLVALKKTQRVSIASLKNSEQRRVSVMRLMRS